MADSEDEYDRKRRDKFRGERSSGDNYRSERRDDRRVAVAGALGRDDWSDRNPFRGGAGARARPDYRDYRGPRDRYGSPGRELPPAKRMRPDWGEDLRGNPRYGGYDPYLMHAWNEHYANHGMHGPYGHGPPPPHPREQAVVGDMQTQPAMLTLKQFLDTQDDGISDSEVLRKYNEYKLEFKRQQLNEFFVAHKDEEWFKNKYHPFESVKRKEEQLGFLKKRASVFKELYDNNSIKSVSIDTSQQDSLLRLLDTVVIKLEGGTDDDLKILDENPRETPVYADRVAENRAEMDDDVIITSVEKRKDDDEIPKVVSPRNARNSTAGTDEENWDEDEGVTVAPVEPKKESDIVEMVKEEKKKEKKTLKRKRTNSDSSSSSSASDSSSSSSSDEDEDVERFKDKYDLEKVNKIEQHKSNDVTQLENIDDDDNEKRKTVEEVSGEVEDGKKVVNGIDRREEHNDGETNNDEVIDTEKRETNEGGEVDEEDDGEEEEEDGTDKISANDGVEVVEDNDKANAEDNAGASAAQHRNSQTPAETLPETIDLDKEKDVPQPRALHRTSSIFLRNLAPSITKAEIEAICRRFDGFLRVAIADPLVERRWFRRGWVTFKRDVTIKEYCWSLNNTRLKDCEMGAIMNRDLSRRVRPVNGMTTHKTIVRADIKLCAKIAMNLDEKFKLWEIENSLESTMEKGGGGGGGGGGGRDGGDKSGAYGFRSNNPVLQNITDFLIEEASAEEDELLGLTGENKDPDGDTIERDVQLISVLDGLILYLRIVHSVDFYNHCEYPYEDEMPNRCGIIHARGPPPQKVSQNDLQDYIKNFENKMQTFLAKTAQIDEDELKNLGCKDPESEVEKFVQANTQELSKDKWLCPLSGKKFKGPEFIRKHIFNKHVEKVDEVRKEVEFFNNYLRDPKRPQLPEHPGSTKRPNMEASGGGGGGGGYRPPAYAPMYPPYAAYAPPMMMPGRGGRGGGFGPRRIGMEYRQITQYRDLDAPQEPADIFN